MRPEPVLIGAVLVALNRYAHAKWGLPLVSEAVIDSIVVWVTRAKVTPVSDPKVPVGPTRI